MTRLTVRGKVWFELDGAFVIGEGGYGLLLGIARYRSLTRAAREVGWSYRHAWGYLRHAEQVIGAPLTRTVSGKGAAKGMALTQSGRHLSALVRRAVALKAANLDHYCAPRSRWEGCRSRPSNPPESH